MSALWMTEAQYVAHQARIKSARVVKLSDGHPEQKNATKEKRAAKLAKTPKVPAVPRPKLSTEEMLALQLAEAGIRLERQYAWLAKPRKRRADFASISHRLLVEVDGAVHRTKKQFAQDILKSQEAVISGYWLLRIGTDQVRMNSAVSIIKQAMAAITAGSAPF